MDIIGYLEYLPSKILSNDLLLKVAMNAINLLRFNKPHLYFLP